MVKSFFARLALKITGTIVLVAAAVTLAWYAHGKIMRVDAEKKHALLEQELQDVAELTLCKMRYSDIITIKKKLLAAKAYSIVRYTGTVRAGIADISAAEIRISADGTRADVTLPRCEIIGNDITSQSVFDEQRSIFLPITTQEIFGEIDAAKDAVAQELQDDGLLDECDSRARALVRRLLERLGFAEITVVTRQESEPLTALTRAMEQVTGH